MSNSAFPVLQERTTNNGRNGKVMEVFRVSFSSSITVGAIRIRSLDFSVQIKNVIDCILTNTDEFSDMTSSCNAVAEGMLGTGTI